jgi:hypothetical protein
MKLWGLGIAMSDSMEKEIKVGKDDNCYGPYYELEGGKSVHVALDDISYMISLGTADIGDGKPKARTRIENGKMFTEFRISREAFDVLVSLKEWIDQKDMNV